MNLDNAKREFIKYIEKYDLEEEALKRKQYHSLRVMEISQQIAEGLEIEEEKIKLATLIGLLHDVARFEQYTKYKTFRDALSIDHGDLGAEILEKDIRKYINTNKYDDIIIKAVKNHNKFKIEEGLSAEEMFYTKIIRDADKIDIFYESVEMFWKNKEEEVEESIVSEDVLQQFKTFSQTKRKVEESAADEVMRVITFIFDMNFKSSFLILKKADYINKILNRYNFKDEETKQKVEKIRKVANKYVNEKVKEDK